MFVPVVYYLRLFVSVTKSRIFTDDSDSELGEKKGSQNDDISLDNNAIFSDDDEQQSKLWLK